MHGHAIDLRPLALDQRITPLILEAEREGHGFMRRLQDEWTSGRNRFDAPGEVLLGAVVGGRLVAVGGLNDDPYLPGQRIGRLRHLYVTASARRIGVGTALVTEITRRASPTFSRLRLRTMTDEGAIFYQRLGFAATDAETATHVLDLGRN